MVFKSFRSYIPESLFLKESIWLIFSSISFVLLSKGISFEILPRGLATLLTNWTIAIISPIVILLLITKYKEISIVTMLTPIDDNVENPEIIPSNILKFCILNSYFNSKSSNLLITLSCTWKHFIISKELKKSLILTFKSENFFDEISCFFDRYLP